MQLIWLFAGFSSIHNTLKVFGFALQYFALNQMEFSVSLDGKIFQSNFDLQKRTKFQIYLYKIRWEVHKTGMFGIYLDWEARITCSGLIMCDDEDTSL